MWMYTRASNSLALVNDAGSAYLPAQKPGVAGTLQNSQCSIAMASAAVTGSGTNLTLTLPITFTAAFKGAKNLYMYALDTSGASTPSMMLKGSWTVPGTSGVPQAVSVSPASGRGSSATFVFTASHGDGAAALRYLYGVFDTRVTTASTCFWRYDAVPQYLWLLDDTGSRYLGPISPGGAQSINNSQCTLGPALSVTANAPVEAVSYGVFRM